MDTEIASFARQWKPFESANDLPLVLSLACPFLHRLAFGIEDYLDTMFGWIGGGEICEERIITTECKAIQVS